MRFVSSRRRFALSGSFAFLKTANWLSSSFWIIPTARRLAVSSAITSAAGKTDTHSIWSIERWLCGSKQRIVSISSPQSSILTGTSIVNGYTSAIPPWTVNCPGSSTRPTRSYPITVRSCFSFSRSSSSPSFSFITWLISCSNGTAALMSASIVVMITFASFW